MSRTHQIIWAAGFFDGEGCVCIVMSNGYWTPRLTVAQNDTRPLIVLRSLFGGRIYKPTKANNAFQWVVTGEASARAAEAMAPFCVYKRDQLEEYINVWDSNPSANSGKCDDARDLAFAVASIKISDMKKQVVTAVALGAEPDGE